MFTACRQAVQITKMSMAVENGDIDKNGPMIEECEKNEKAAQLTPEATHFIDDKFNCIVKLMANDK